MDLSDAHELLAVLGKALYMASPSTTLTDRMKEPRPGDLVLEVSIFSSTWDPDRIGRLVRIEGTAPDDRIIVAPLHDPEREQGWRNAEFIAIPDVAPLKWLEADAVDA